MRSRVIVFEPVKFHIFLTSTDFEFQTRSIMVIYLFIVHSKICLKITKLSQTNKKL